MVQFLQSLLPLIGLTGYVIIPCNELPEEAKKWKEKGEMAYVAMNNSSRLPKGRKHVYGNLTVVVC